MSDANLAALYQEMILDHYRRPRNKGELEHPDASVEMKNPLCGDEIGLQISFEGGVISDLKFTGHGCSISQASASMMTELVKGKESVEAEQIRAVFRAMVMGDATAATNPVLGKTRALSGVSKYPARVKCALLGWNALESGIEQHGKTAGHSAESFNEIHEKTGQTGTPKLDSRLRGNDGLPGATDRSSTTEPDD